MSNIIPPAPIDAQFGAYNWIDWYEKVRLAINNATNTIPVTQGGTGLTSYVSGDMLYANTTTSLSALHIGTNQFLYATGGIPVWTTLLPIINGGTGTASPALIAGTNITITGSWPNNTINASGGSTPTTSSPAFSATPTLSPTDIIYFGTLTGNVTAFNLSGTYPKLQVRFTQDSTGGRTVAVGSSIEFFTDIPNLNRIGTLGPNAGCVVGFDYNPITSKYTVVAIIA